MPVIRKLQIVRVGLLPMLSPMYQVTPFAGSPTIVSYAVFGFWGLRRVDAFQTIVSDWSWRSIWGVDNKLVKEWGGIGYEALVLSPLTRREIKIAALIALVRAWRF